MSMVRKAAAEEGLRVLEHISGTLAGILECSALYQILAKLAELIISNEDEGARGVRSYAHTTHRSRNHRQRIRLTGLGVCSGSLEPVGYRMTQTH